MWKKVLNFLWEKSEEKFVLGKKERKKIGVAEHYL
jgi:hypothetical protein